MSSATPSPTSSCSELWAEQALTYVLPASTRCSNCAKCAPERSMKRCSECRLVVYCSPNCQRKHQGLHKTVCRLTPHLAPVIPVAWGLRFKDTPFESYSDLALTTCASTHMTQQLGWLCKATELIGVPMWLAPANLEEPEYVASKDLTSICHHLMMDPGTGFATDEWTSRPQYREINYTVFHADMRPLSERTFETVLAFLKMVVDHGSGLSPSDGWVPMQTFLSPQAFQIFSRQYWWQQAGNQDRHGWEELTHPL